MKFRNSLAFFFFLTGAIHIQAQVSCIPVFPVGSDSVTIYFDATQGDGGLASFTGSIYAHTGVITNLSTGSSDWKYVKHPWATAFDDIKLTPIGNHIYTLKINTINSYYGVPAGETVRQLAFVFRDSVGAATGRAPGGADIFYNVYSANSTTLLMKLVQPAQKTNVDSLSGVIPVDVEASIAGAITLKDNGTVVASASNARSLKYAYTPPGAGYHSLVFSSTAASQTLTDSFSVLVAGAVQIAEPPTGTQLGANISADGTSATFAFQAPRKNTVYMIGNFNNWKLDNNYLMKQSSDGKTWWLTITGLTPGQTYLYQYVVNGSLFLADPLSTLILDPANDSYINTAGNTVFPNIPAYPTGLTTGFVSVIYPGKAPYAWQATNFQRPAQGDLVVYELLVRDFSARHSYQALIDSMSYFKSLHINAIELMPIAEFDGNDSWGYNPDYHMALDKYYGTPDKFKEFIDLCHQNGIAVIMDVVFNQVTSNSPLYQMYNAGGNPSPDNPWLNVAAPHPFSVFNDFNHESQYTKDYMDRCLKNWLTDYHVDGFRFDLAKGFTQFYSGNDNTLASQYDQSRVNILTRIYNVIQATTPGCYGILEYFVANSEEMTMANKGAMVWGNMNYNFNQNTMGYSSGSALDWTSYKSRGYTNPNLISYMESHDEERLMFNNESYGNSSGAYNVKSIPTGLQRMEAASALHYTVPGAKMLWQFGEMGYDISINQNGRTGDKPLHWEYLTDPNRKHLYDVTRDLINLKIAYPAFRTGTHNPTELDAGLTLAFHVSDASVNATVLSNLDVVTKSVTPNFQHTGWWYDYLSGDSVNVGTVSANRSLLPGEYHVYTDKKLPVPPSGYLSLITTGTNDIASYVSVFDVYPNPSHGGAFAGYHLSQAGSVSLDIFDMLGNRVYGQSGMNQPEGSFEQSIPESLASGMYFVRISVNGGFATLKWVKE